MCSFFSSNFTLFSRHLILSFGYLWASPPPNQNPAYAYAYTLYDESEINAFRAGVSILIRLDKQAIPFPEETRVPEYGKN